MGRSGGATGPLDDDDIANGDARCVGLSYILDRRSRLILLSRRIRLPKARYLRSPGFVPGFSFLRSAAAARVLKWAANSQYRGSPARLPAFSRSAATALPI